MNKIERFVYDQLKSSPAVKNVVRNLYQSLFDLLPTPANRSVAPIQVKENYFFGFHDKSPFSSDQTMLLAHIACDLHPRMSPDGRFVSFDSVHTGLRSLCVMPYPENCFTH